MMCEGKGSGRRICIGSEAFLCARIGSRNTKMHVKSHYINKEKSHSTSPCCLCCLAINGNMIQSSILMVTVQKLMTVPTPGRRVGVRRVCYIKIKFNAVIVNLERVQENAVQGS